jgi:hypothetical protein
MSKSSGGLWEIPVLKVSLGQPVFLDHQRSKHNIVIKSCLMCAACHNSCYPRLVLLLESKLRTTLTIHWIRAKARPFGKVLSQSIIFHKKKLFLRFKKWWASLFLTWKPQTMERSIEQSLNREASMITQRLYSRNFKQLNKLSNSKIFHSTFKTHLITINMIIFWTRDWKEDLSKNLLYLWRPCIMPR